jgi:hypothetical protein
MFFEKDVKKFEFAIFVFRYKKMKKEHYCLNFKNILGLKEKYEILKKRNP